MCCSCPSRINSDGLRFKLLHVANCAANCAICFTCILRDQHRRYSILISPGGDHCSRQGAHELQASVISCLHPMGATVIRCFCFCDSELFGCVYMQLLQLLPGRAKVSTAPCPHVTLQISCSNSNFRHACFSIIPITNSVPDDVALIAATVTAARQV